MKGERERGKRKNPGSDKPNIEGPIAEMLKRVRTKEAKRKAGNEVGEQDPNKKAVSKGRANSNRPTQGLLGLLSSTDRQRSAKENARC